MPNARLKYRIEIIYWNGKCVSDHKSLSLLRIKSKLKQHQSGRFHRIRHYGLLANSGREDNLKCARKLLKEHADKTIQEKETSEGKTTEADKTMDAQQATYVCPNCNHPMLIIESFRRGQMPRAPPERIESS